jgi:hypothetical protein
MKRALSKTFPWILATGTALAFVVVTFLYLLGKKDTAESIVRTVSALGVVIAVIVALYGEWIKSQLNPFALGITDPLRQDNFLNNEHGKEVYAHHLRVENLKPYLAVKNCRVWLIRVLDVQGGHSPVEPFTFGVGRLMAWAPLEYSPDVRSFSEDQVFDFGVTFVDEGVFRPTFYKEQGGAFHPRGDCAANQTRWYVFEITADNYVGSRHFTVEASVQEVTPSQEWPHKFRTKVSVLPPSTADQRE